MTSEEFEHIAIGLRSQLLQIAMNFCHDEDDAEDIVQEVMLRLWMRRDKLDHDVTSLACKATRNMCVSWWRKEQVRCVVPLAEDLPLEESRQTDDQLMMDEQIKLLQQCIAQLSRSQQRLIRLKLFEGLDTQEIAAITGITPRSVIVMLSAAKQKLMETLVERTWGQGPSTIDN